MYILCWEIAYFSYIKLLSFYGIENISYEEIVAHLIQISSIMLFIFLLAICLKLSVAQLDLILQQVLSFTFNEIVLIRIDVDLILTFCSIKR